MAKVRVSALAKELGTDSKTLIAHLNSIGEYVKTASSTIEAPVVRKATETFPEDLKKAPAKKAGRQAARSAAPAAPAAAQAAVRPPRPRRPRLLPPRAGRSRPPQRACPGSRLPQPPLRLRPPQPLPPAPAAPAAPEAPAARRRRPVRP